MNINSELFQGQVIGRLQGSVVSDALGVPVEFTLREKLRTQPVMGMMSGGEHDQLIVTWPDDTSMVLCTIKSLIECTDQMSRFEEWLWRGSNTAHNEVFVVGGLT